MNGSENEDFQNTNSAVTAKRTPSLGRITKAKTQNANRPAKSDSFPVSQQGYARFSAKSFRRSNPTAVI